jgi:hypothetical protein
VISVWRDFRRYDVTNSRKKLVVTACDSPPGFGPRSKVWKLDTKNCRLKPIKPAVDALHDVIALAAVTGICCTPIRQLRIVGDNTSGIPVSTKIFSRIK